MGLWDTVEEAAIHRPSVSTTSGPPAIASYTTMPSATGTVAFVSPCVTTACFHPAGTFVASDSGSS
jgi:hypothetical protein